MEHRVERYLTAMFDSSYTMDGFFNHYTQQRKVYIKISQVIHRLKYLQAHHHLMENTTICVDKLSEKIQFLEMENEALRHVFDMVESTPLDELRMRYGHKSVPWYHAFQGREYMVDWFGTDVWLWDILEQRDNVMVEALSITEEIEQSRADELGCRSNVRI